MNNEKKNTKKTIANKQTSETAKKPKKIMGNDRLLDAIKKTSSNPNQNAFEERLEEHSKRLLDGYGDTVLEDGYSNAILGLGRDDKKDAFNSWDFFMDSNNWSLWIALYSDSWIFRKAIDKPSQDIANLGLRFVDNSNDLTKIKGHLRYLKFELTQLLMWGSLFGGAISIMLFDNVALTDLDKPLLENDKRLKNVKKVKLFTVDRWSGLRPYTTDLVLETTSIDFLKPKYYDVTIGGDSYKVHYTWVLRYDNRIAPNLLRNGQLNSWGYAEGVHLITEIKRDEKLKHSISSLVDKSLIEIIKMSGMRSAFMGMDEGNDQQMQQRLEMVNWGRNFNSLTFLDKEDDYQQNEFGGLNGLADLMDKNMENIAAALDMTGVLFGDMSGGFSPDNFALVRYDTTIRNRAESYFKPLLSKLIKVLAQIEGIKDDVDLDFEFETMIQVNADPLEKAQQYTALFSSMIGDGYMSRKQAGQEMMALSEELGIGTSITEATLNELEKEEDMFEEESQNLFGNENEDEENGDFFNKE